MSASNVETQLVDTVRHLRDDPAKLAVRYLRAEPHERAMLQRLAHLLAQGVLEEFRAYRRRTARLESAANALLDQMAADAGDWTAAATRRYVELDRALRP